MEAIVKKFLTNIGYLKKEKIGLSQQVGKMKKLVIIIHTDNKAIENIHINIVFIQFFIIKVMFHTLIERFTNHSNMTLLDFQLQIYLCSQFHKFAYEYTC